MDAWIEATDGILVNPRHVRSLRVCPFDRCAFLRLTDSSTPGFEDGDIETPLPLKLRAIEGLQVTDVTPEVFAKWIPRWHEVPDQI